MLSYDLYHLKQAVTEVDSSSSTFDLTFNDYAYADIILLMVLLYFPTILYHTICYYNLYTYSVSYLLLPRLNAPFLLTSKKWRMTRRTR